MPVSVYFKLLHVLGWA